LKELERIRTAWEKLEKRREFEQLGKNLKDLERILRTWEEFQIFGKNLKD
jgi:hypothetical protein